MDDRTERTPTGIGKRGSFVGLCSISGKRNRGRGSLVWLRQAESGAGQPCLVGLDIIWSAESGGGAALLGGLCLMSGRRNRGRASLVWLRQAESGTGQPCLVGLDVWSAESGGRAALLGFVRYQASGIGGGAAVFG